MKIENGSLLFTKYPNCEFKRFDFKFSNSFSIFKLLKLISFSKFKLFWYKKYSFLYSFKASLSFCFSKVRVEISKSLFSISFILFKDLSSKLSTYKNSFLLILNSLNFFKSSFFSLLETTASKFVDIVLKELKAKTKANTKANIIKEK